ncbi:hypothetical protein H5410_006403 [Solanum commersonii]|uniref:Uncharacterized protein n=1 Tax=Solanum commersonii TaxID=4109 RepID=A0A9J6A9M1_SOLCO|nr:hypothetical protein H5410_006403 [Solanum commersonii]
MEPFQDIQKLERYQQRLGMQHVVSNINGKIWAFMEADVEYEVVSDSEQQITLKLKEESFKEVVAQNWKAEFEGNPFSLFHYKLKKVKRALAQWSKETFGNIFHEIATLEDTIKVLETQFEDTPSGKNRSRLQKAQAELYTQL